MNKNTKSLDVCTDENLSDDFTNFFLVKSNFMISIDFLHENLNSQNKNPDRLKDLHF